MHTVGTTLISNGCAGGSIRNAFKYAITNGVTLLSNYAYTGSQTSCNTSKPIVSGFNISGCVNVPTYSEQSLRNAVHRTPVAVPMNGDAAGFIYYSYGQYDALDCDPTIINHVVTITGWST
uniref:Predicted protein n=1 Tax=Hordeum vulgare subsp. vulgare TaxID=112509 RepID=F2DX64_HORVV|nr:predicted protein [Hordeum vulgare subsp. vulgare]